MTLAVAIICKDSERTIEQTLRTCRQLLDSIPGSGPLVAFDSGSTDSTLALLERYGALVIPCTWMGYIGTKQAALDHTTSLIGEGWVLCLDSDESVDDELHQHIKQVVSTDDKTLQGAWVNRRVWIWGKLLRFTWQPEWRLRLVRTNKAFWTGHDPHDYLKLKSKGATIRLGGMLRHDTFVSFDDMLGKSLKYGRIAGQSAYAAKRKTNPIRVVLGPIGAFAKHYVLKGGFLDGAPGLLAAATTAAYTLMKHIVWYELQRTRPANDGGVQSIRSVK